MINKYEITWPELPIQQKCVTDKVDDYEIDKRRLFVDVFYLLIPFH